MNGVLKPTNLTARMIRWFLSGWYPATDPTLLLEDNQSLSPFGVDATVLHTPGHTAGSITLLTAEGDALVGDLIMGGYFGGKLFPTRPGLHYFIQDMNELRASLRRVLDRSPRRIYPGHGGPLAPEAVARWLGSQRAQSGMSLATSFDKTEGR
jgi:glyoxylase-like metal-dependent hydrolase (beta-lactamase superfamily II)